MHSVLLFCCPADRSYTICNVDSALQYIIRSIKSYKRQRKQRLLSSHSNLIWMFNNCRHFRSINVSIQTRDVSVFETDKSERMRAKKRFQDGKEKKRMIKIMNETTQLSATWMCLVWWFYKHIGYDSWRKWLDKSRTHTSTRTPPQTLLEYSNDEFIIETSHIHICVGIQHMACSIDRVYIYCLWNIAVVCVWDCVKFVWSRSVFLLFCFNFQANDSNDWIDLQFRPSCCYHMPCFVFTCHRISWYKKLVQDFSFFLPF